MSKNIIETEKLVACLPGYENKNVEKSLYFRLTKRFYHRSGTQLKFEAEQRQKLICWSSKDNQELKPSMS